MKKCDKNLSRFTYFNKLNITNKTNYYNSRLTLVNQEIARFKDLHIIKLQPKEGIITDVRTFTRQSPHMQL